MSGKWSRNAPEQTNVINFSFCDYKSFFECILVTPTYQELIVEDIRDFWKFVNKYERMLRSSGQPILPEPLAFSKATQESEFTSFHKTHFLPMQLTYDPKDCPLGRYSEDNKHLTKLKIHQFIEIVLTYLDFKQKEKFTKIKKLRAAQKNLPIAKFKKQIQENLKSNQVLIIAGDTGCGKSTQIPQYLYEFGFRNIACTQPRRLACTSLSKRVAHEMLNDYGSKVGFQIRFEKHKTADTNILFITEGLLLRQLSVDSNLDQYDVLILDEIHERNLFGDFLLGVTKCLLRAKKSMKLVLMSATINVELFANYFKEEGAQLIEVPGRLFPIKTHYLPPPTVDLPRTNTHKEIYRLDPTPYTQVLSIIDNKIPVSEKGDVLIFASGVNEITSICDGAKNYAAEKNNHWIILPLHSGLALAEQDKVFDYAPDGMRKCIVATNIAETSLTVDGVRFVVDSGKVKEMSYDASSKSQRLKEFWVSKSSAEQRKGRAGRTGPGICYRIYSEQQFESFEPYPTPEIFRVPLDTILLQMINMGLPNVRVFPFVEKPTDENIESTLLGLKQNNALAIDEKITPLGRALSNLPVEISIGKMLLMGCVFAHVENILTLAAALSVQNPFTNRAYFDNKCTQERMELESDQGDIFTLLKAYYQWLTLKLDNSENTRKWCHKKGIEEQRFYEIAKLRKQFQNILETSNMLPSSKNNEPQSWADRSRRHGELRMLKAIKRKQAQHEPKQRKFLRRNHNNEEDFEDNRDDMRDVDFRLSHDSNKLDVLLSSCDTRRHRDVVLLKLIIVSGLYPQIAVPDEFNNCKSGTQQFFHTIVKPYLSLHPNSQFAKTFEVLKLTDSDIQDPPNYYTQKLPFSMSHQILCYQNLLETAKPYLMNCIRMPAAQTILLFSFSIDTNFSLSRIVCDSWLCLEFPVAGSGITLLTRAMKLRYKWLNLLNEKLNDLSHHKETDVKKTTTTDEQTELWDDLVAYMNTKIPYTIKRLLPADLKTLYHAQQYTEPESLIPNPFLEGFEPVPNEEKGGLNVTENLVYGCLREVQWTIAMDMQLSREMWKCPVCNEEETSEGITIPVHKLKCKPKNSEQKKSEVNADDQRNEPSRSGTTRYICPTCNKTLYLTAIDVLRHRKSCGQKK